MSGSSTFIGKHPLEDTVPPAPKDKVKYDAVNHPRHYKSHPSGVECIEITRHMGFNLGNAMKYIWRADTKGNAIEDLRKAAWYIEDEIKRRSTAPAPNV